MQISEFKASLVYRGTFIKFRFTHITPSKKIKKKKKKRRRRKGKERKRKEKKKEEKRREKLQE